MVSLLENQSPKFALMWGDGANGKLGFDHTESFKIPTFLPTFKPKSIAIGDHVTVAID
jgi:hypothetical protein